MKGFEWGVLRGPRKISPFLVLGVEMLFGLMLPQLILAEPSRISPVAVKDSSCLNTENSFRCVEFVKNYDADTITVNIQGVHPLIGKKMSVRVRHVDTPEIKGQLPCEKDVARDAQRLVENVLKRAKRIDLVNVGKDKYFRILADVIVDGKSLKDLLIKNNLAYSYEGGTKLKIDWCSRAPANSKQGLRAPSIGAAQD